MVLVPSSFLLIIGDTDDGKIESLTPQSVPVTDIIVESLDIASTVRDSNKKKE